MKEYASLEYPTIRYLQVHERCPETETIRIPCGNRHRSAATHPSPTILILSISTIQLGQPVVLNILHIFIAVLLSVVVKPRLVCVIRRYICFVRNKSPVPTTSNAHSALTWIPN